MKKILLNVAVWILVLLAVSFTASCAEEDAPPPDELSDAERALRLFEEAGNKMDLLGSYTLTAEGDVLVVNNGVEMEIKLEAIETLADLQDENTSIHTESTVVVTTAGKAMRFDVQEGFREGKMYLVSSIDGGEEIKLRSECTREAYLAYLASESELDLDAVVAESGHIGYEQSEDGYVLSFSGFSDQVVDEFSISLLGDSVMASDGYHCADVEIKVGLDTNAYPVTIDIKFVFEPIGEADPEEQEDKTVPAAEFRVTVGKINKTYPAAFSAWGGFTEPTVSLSKIRDVSRALDRAKRSDQGEFFYEYEQSDYPTKISVTCRGTYGRDENGYYFDLKTAAKQENESSGYVTQETSGETRYANGVLTVNGNQQSDMSEETAKAMIDGFLDGGSFSAYFITDILDQSDNDVERYVFKMKSSNASVSSLWITVELQDGKLTKYTTSGLSNGWDVIGTCTYGIH